MKTLAVFASGSGSNLQSIIDEIENNSLPAHIAFVLSNNSNAFALERARQYRIPAIHFSAVKFPDTREFDNKLLQLLVDNNVELIVLAGYMKLLPAIVVQAFKGKILNIHPGLLPKYGGKGMFGMNVHQAVIAGKEKESGATVFFVTEAYDDGPVILCEKVPVLADDTPELLAKRVLAVEHRIYPEAIRQVCSGRVVMSAD
ncbi:MAG: phosphoribosylglycinamide formyltransferase [Elusimicrobia bacterium RIFOXYB2_FULL_49_7]|nr:MAG: phosphoribosylglycinamide formyltransferase [Elusimicrobia bacterium RIFOXYB2_FULL_49_7]